MTERAALRRRALRPAAVALATWVAAAIATVVPDAVMVAGGLASMAFLAVTAFMFRRAAVIGVAAVALACGAAASAGVASVAPLRAQVDALAVTGGRHLELEAVVTGRIDPSADGGAWFDARATSLEAGRRRLVADIPVRVGVDADGRRALARTGVGSPVRLSGRALPSDPGERAVIVLRAGEVVSASPPPGAWAWFQNIRERLISSTRGLPQPGAGLIPGLAVGDTSALDPATEASMNASSLSHLTAVSGANCAIVVGAAFALFAACGAGRGVRVIGAVLVLGGFVCLVTPEPSVVRAAAMAAVAMLALALGRPAIGIAVLSTAVVVLLIVDPWLSRSIGFALSAAATGALLVLARPLATGLERWMPRPLALAIAVPTAAQLACGPLIVLIDPHVPLLGVGANMLADPAAAPATILAALACIAPFPWVQDGLTALAWIPASWIAAVARTSSSVSAQNLPWPDGVVGAILLATVGAAIGLVIVRPQRVPRLTALSTAAMAVVTGLVLGQTTVSTVAGPLTVPAGWQVAMCDVGQGDATLWRSAGEVALVDTGPDPEPLRRCLRTLGITHLDLLVLTHFDLDHVGGTAAVTGEVTRVLHGPVDAAADQRLLDRLSAGGADVQQARAGMTGVLGDTRWQALGPPPRVEPGNDASIALDVAGTGFPRTVLLGDLGEQAQAALVRRVDIPRVDVVKVSHHGSADQDADLYRRLHARIALIGVGAGNSYGHPTASLLSILAALGTTVGRTDQEGILAAWQAPESGLTLWRQRPPAGADSSP